MLRGSAVDANRSYFRAGSKKWHTFSCKYFSMVSVNTIPAADADASRRKASIQLDISTTLKIKK